MNPSETRPGTLPGILMVHGFGGEPAELAPLESSLRAKGFETHSITLRGHAGRRGDLRSARYGDWLADARAGLNGLRRKHATVYAVGFSMGGLVLLDLAAEGELDGLVTLNTPIRYWNLRLIAGTILRELRTRQWNRIPHYLHSGIKFPLHALLQFRLLLHHSKKQLRKVRCPVLVAQGLQDDTAHPSSAEHILKEIRSADKRLRTYPASGHLLCYEPDQAQMIEDVLDFLTQKSPDRTPH